MQWLIFWDGCYVGTVDAPTSGEALTRADERFGPIYGGVTEAVPTERRAGERRHRRMPRRGLTLRSHLDTLPRSA